LAALAESWQVMQARAVGFCQAVFAHLPATEQVWP
jgi:hypothetical protein